MFIGDDLSVVVLSILLTQFLEKHKEEFEKRNVEESKKVIKLKQQLNLRKIKYKEVKGKLAQKVKEGNEIEKRKNEVHKVIIYRCISHFQSYLQYVKYML